MSENKNRNSIVKGLEISRNSSQWAFVNEIIETGRCVYDFHLQPTWGVNFYEGNEIFLHLYFLSSYIIHLMKS